MSTFLRAIKTALPDVEAIALAGGKKNTNAYLALIKVFALNLERHAASWSEWAKLAKEAPEASLWPTIEPIGGIGRSGSRASGAARRPATLPHTDVRSREGALANYQAIKQELGALDFADQEHQLLGLLDHPKWQLCSTTSSIS